MMKKTMDKKVKKQKILIRIGVVLVFILGLIWFLKLMFVSYEHSAWWYPYDYKLRTQDFSTHSVPDEYEVVTFRWNHKSPRRFLLYRNKETNQYFALAKLPEFHRINYSRLSMSEKNYRKPSSSDLFSIQGTEFQIGYYFPFPWRTDFEHSKDDMTIHGIQAKGDERKETDLTDIKYIYGDFSQLVFTKKSDNFMKFVPVVFDFKENGIGAIALIKDKETQDILIAIGFNADARLFDKTKFQAIVESVTFEAHPEPPPFHFLKEEKKTVGIKFRS